MSETTFKNQNTILPVCQWKGTSLSTMSAPELQKKEKSYLRPFHMNWKNKLFKKKR